MNGPLFANANWNYCINIFYVTRRVQVPNGFSKGGKRIHLKKCQQITITIGYRIKGDDTMIAMSYRKLAEDLEPDCHLYAIEAIALVVLSVSS